MQEGLITVIPRHGDVAGKGVETKAASPPNVRIMKRGAVEFKQVLTQVRYLPVWIVGTSGDSAAIGAAVIG